MSVIESVSELKTLTKACLKTVMFHNVFIHPGDYQFRKLKGNLLMEIKVELLDGKRVLNIYIHGSSGNSKQLLSLSLGDCKSWYNKDFIKVIEQALVKQMFIRLGETKQMVFDDLDYYYVYTKKLDKTICEEVEQAMKNFHSGLSKVKAPFRKLLSVPVQLI
jgi:hypothetical protein